MNSMKHTKQEIDVRAAEAGDAAAIDELIVGLDAFHADARPDLFRRPLGTPRGTEFLEKVLGDPQQQVFVALSAHTIVGYAHAIIKHVTMSEHRLERHYSEIDTISVHPEARRLGAGRKLMEAAINWAEARGVRDHQVAVHEFNSTARRLYEQLGFVPSVTVLRRNI